jgi:hypothetical protein
VRLLAALTVLAACGAPRPAPSDAPEPTPPSIDALKSTLSGMGFIVRADGDRLRFGHDGPGGGYEVIVRVLDEVPCVRIATDGLFAMSSAADDRGAALLLTAIATLNHELASGRLGLDPADGDVELSVDLPAEEGVGERTFPEGVGRLIGAADAVHPRLAAAARGEAL